MKSKSIFLMVVSLGFGLVAAVGITQVMGRSKAAPEKEVNTVPVLVAIEDLDINTELQPEMFKVEQWPAEIAPEDVATTIEQITDQVVTSRVSKRAPIFVADLLPKSEANILPIPAGFKVVGIKLAADDHLGGLLQPGDYVDLIGIFAGNRQRRVPISRTFLKRIRVFNVGSSISTATNRDPSAKGNVVVGLLVDEKQSEQILLIRQVAQLKLAMRGADDMTGMAQDDADWQREFGLGDEKPSPETNNASELGQMLKGIGDPSGLAGYATTNFEMTVHYSDGPVRFRFNDEGRVPVKIEGFAADPDQITPPNESQDVQTPDAAENDFDGNSVGMDSDPLSDEFDSKRDN